ncbi:endonuclease III [Inquilinus sp. Marseille-Q2685]|uniref:endonuclease III domain-containing protein n=1 Tax=Inquilinus sp. Marseille-Q2685 TaxID=2866581 RepID=UPI001CE4730F|nr:Fe-S cluster assembly protein HesB [Inquilinus sp. Marseille-Q2685]
MPATTRLIRIDAALATAFGPAPRFLYPDPVEMLVLALLSARTRDEIAMAAHRVLRVRFPRWQDLLEADPAVIERLVGRTTWPDRKAQTLQQALRALQASRGRLELDFLAGLGAEDAVAWLRTLPGVGPKTAAAVLLFSRLRLRALPVSTGHHRIAKRLGLISRRAGAEAAHGPLLAMLPPDWDNDRIERHHWLVKRLGHDHCTDRRPRCGSCPVRELCPSRGRIRPAPEHRIRQLALPFPAMGNRPHPGLAPAGPTESSSALRHKRTKPSFSIETSGADVRPGADLITFPKTEQLEARPSART